MYAAAAVSLQPVIDDMQAVSSSIITMSLYSCHMSKQQQAETSMVFGVQAASHDAQGPEVSQCAAE